MVWTENSLIAGFVTLGLMIVLIVLIGVVRYGFRVEIGWLYFRMFANQPEGMISESKVKKIVDEKVQKAVDTHMSALEAFKDTIRSADDNLKALIAHHLADIDVPESTEFNMTTSQLVVFAVRLELLTLNAENHYAQAALSKDSLKDYLSQRYNILQRAFRPFSSDSVYVRRAAFEVLNSWWGTVSPKLIQTINVKIVTATHARNACPDDLWRNRIDIFVKEQKEMLNNLGDVKNLSQYVDYKSSRKD